MAEITAMEALDMLDNCCRNVSWGARLYFEKRWSTNHWREDSKALDPVFDSNKPETVKEYLSKIHNKLPES